MIQRTNVGTSSRFSLGLFSVTELVYTFGTSSKTDIYCLIFGESEKESSSAV